MLQDFAQNLHARIPDPGLTIVKMAQILNSMRGFKNAAEVYSLPVAARFVKFAKLFPKLFRLAGEAGRLRVFKAPREPKAPKPEAASSSTGPKPEARARGPYQARAVEFEPRAAAKKYQNVWHVIYNPENPSKRLGPKHTRYEKYKVATTIGEARRLGSTSQDLKLDEENGALQINYWGP